MVLRVILAVSATGKGAYSGEGTCYEFGQEEVRRMNCCSLSSWGTGILPVGAEYVRGISGTSLGINTQGREEIDTGTDSGRSS